MTATERARLRRRRHVLAVAPVLLAGLTSCAANQPAPKPATAGQISEPDMMRLRSLDPTPHPSARTEPKRQATRRPTPARIGTALHIAIPGVFLRLADCESGEWDRHRHPIWNSRRWDYNDGHYVGGFNFAPSTYAAYKPHGYPPRADLASPGQQYVVARRVLRDQGVRAWPICGPKVGLTVADAA